MRSKHVNVQIDLDRIRASAERVKAATRAALIAVIKSDAYGLGAERVADALAGVADEFAYFSLAEAAAVRRPGLVLGPADGPADAFAALRVRPAVADRQSAGRYRGVSPAVNVDTGMQRFGCRPEDAEELLRVADSRELFTHAASEQAASVLANLGGSDVRRHAAATALLDAPRTWFDAVRPGLALYRGALRVTARLVQVRDVRGPVGYSGFSAARVGVILAGYSQHLASAPVLIGGRPERILEVGMNTSFVSVGPRARAGDEVVLLGDGLDEQALADALGVRPHEVLCRYAGMGQRVYQPRLSRYQSIDRASPSRKSTRGS